MPYKEGKKWRAVVKIQNQRSTSLHPTKQEALKWEKDEKARLSRTSTTYLDLCNKFLEYSELKNSEQHFIEKKRILKAFGLYIQDEHKELSEITVSICHDFIIHKAKETSNNAANKYRKILKSAWAYIIEVENFDFNPWSKTRSLHHEKRQAYVPSIEDITKLLEIVNIYDKAFLLCYLYSGARMREIWRLTWADDIDLLNKTIRLATRKRSGGIIHYDWIPMIDELYEVLVAIPQQHTHVFYNYQTGKPYVWRHHFIENLCRKAGIQKFGYHGLRRFVASNLFDSGIGMKQIQKLLRHKNLLTTEKYILDMNKDLKDSMKILGKIR